MPSIRRRTRPAIHADARHPADARLPGTRDWLASRPACTPWKHLARACHRRPRYFSPAGDEALLDGNRTEFQEELTMPKISADSTANAMN